MNATVDVKGSGDARTLEVDGKPLLDGRTGRPATFRKADLFGAMYGQRNEAWWAIRAMSAPEELKTCG